MSFRYRSGSVQEIVYLEIVQGGFGMKQFVVQKKYLSLAKQAFIICALSTVVVGIPTLKASISTSRLYHSYLVKVTNNSSKTFRVFCSNKDWDTVLFVDPSQLDLFTSKFDTPIPKAQADYLELVQERNIRIQELKGVEGKTDKQIEQDSQIKALDAKIKPLEEMLRPIIKPHSVADNLPCRIFGPDDIPNYKPKGWHWPETILKDGIKIEFIDTNKKNGCPIGNTKITAKSPAGTTSLCVDTSLYFGRVHVTIEEDGTLKLEQLKDIPLQQ